MTLQEAIVELAAAAVEGALDSLRTDEAMDRVASAIVDSFGAAEHPMIDNLVVNDDGTVDLSGQFKYEVIARAAIRGLLGEEK